MQFGRDYFEGGAAAPAGTNSSYHWEDYALTFRNLAKFLTLNGPGRSLDIGCAHGFMVRSLRELGWDAYGVDVSEFAVGQADSEVREFLTVVDLNSTALPYATGAFDLITFLGTMEYVKNQDFALSELARVLAPEGAVVVSTHIRPDAVRAYARPTSWWTAEMAKHGLAFRAGPTAEVRWWVYSTRLRWVLDHGHGFVKAIALRLYHLSPVSRRGLEWVYLRRAQGVTRWFYFRRGGSPRGRAE